MRCEVYVPAEAERQKEADLEAARGSDLWDQAVQKYRKEVPLGCDQIRNLIADDPEGWWIPYHLLRGGMAARNLFRDWGFGEKEFVIVNLDNIYVALLEEAAKE